MLRGFDVSHFQGPVDWAALEAAYGIDFGGCKATEGTSFRDSEFPVNWAKLADLAMDVGIVRMAYHYGHPARDPDQSAVVFLDYVHDLEPMDLLVLDLETGDGLSQAEVNQWAKAWAAAVRALAPSHSPVLYTGHAYMENQTGVGLNGPYGSWWYARYPSSLANAVIWPATFNPTLPSPNAWGGPPDFWQYSSTFPSIGGQLDANVYNGTLDQLCNLNGGDVELTDTINMKKADGTRTVAGNALNLDSIPVGVALTYGAASFAYLRNVVKTLLDGLPDSLAAKLGDIADPAEVKAATAAAIQESGILGVLPGQ